MIIGTRDFRRRIQTDDYSCGSRAVEAVLDWADLCTPHALLKYQLKTRPEHGTTVSRIIAVLRNSGLRVGYRPKLSWRGLVHALKNGAVVLAHCDGDHWVVVFGVDRTHVHVADSSLLRCAGRRQTRRRWLKRWARWGLLIRTPLRKGMRSPARSA